MNIEYFVMKAGDGGYLRFKRGVEAVGPAHRPKCTVVQVESSSSGAEGSWVPRGEIPPATAGFVSHNMALLHACALVFGQVNGFVKGSQEELDKLSLLLKLLA